MDVNNLINEPNPGVINPYETEMVLTNPASQQEPEVLIGKTSTDQTKPPEIIEGANSSHPIFHKENTKETEETAPFVRLSGAGRKRMIWLMRQGKSREEARILAAQPAFCSRRQRGGFNKSGFLNINPNTKSGSATPQQTKVEHNKTREVKPTIEHSVVSPQEVKTQNNEAVDVSPRTSVNSPNPPSVHSQQKEVQHNETAETEPITAVPPPKSPAQETKVVILHKEYPNSLLTSDQLKEVLDLILRNIVIENRVKPRFHGSHFKAGYLIITCADEETVEWLKNLEEKLVLKKGTQVKIVDEFHLPKPYIATAFFQDCKDDTNEFILQLIKAQNSNLHVDNWKILKRSESDSQTEISFSIDSSSAEWLTSTRERVSFKFGEIQLRLNSLNLDIAINDEVPNT